MEVNLALARPYDARVASWKICAVKIELFRECDAHEGYIEIWAVKTAVVDGIETIISLPKQVILLGDDYRKFMEQQRLDLVTFVRDRGCFDE